MHLANTQHPRNTRDRTLSEAIHAPRKKRHGRLSKILCRSSRLASRRYDLNLLLPSSFFVSAIPRSLLAFLSIPLFSAFVSFCCSLLFFTKKNKQRKKSESLPGRSGPTGRRRRFPSGNRDGLLKKRGGDGPHPHPDSPRFCERECKDRVQSVRFRALCCTAAMAWWWGQVAAFFLSPTFSL